MQVISAYAAWTWNTVGHKMWTWIYLMDVIYSKIGRKLTFWMVARNWDPQGLAGIYIYIYMNHMHLEKLEIHTEWYWQWHTIFHTHWLWYFFIHFATSFGMFFRCAHWGWIPNTSETTASRPRGVASPKTATGDATGGTDGNWWWYNVN